MTLNQYLPWLLAVVAVGFASFYFFRKKHDDLPPRYTGPQPVSSEEGEHRTLSVYGDSITVLLDLSGLNASFLNRAVAGTNFMQWMLGQVPTLLPIPEQLQRDPSSVILSRYGMNDLLFGTPPDMFRQAVLQFIIGCRENGQVPVLSNLTKITTPFHDEKKDRALVERKYIYDDILKSMAAQFNVHFIDVDSVFFAGPGDLEDGLHPTKDGAYAERIRVFIATKIIELNILPGTVEEGEPVAAAAA
ncbi:hypothetical protein D3C71_77170 [compost metagenome]